MEKYALIKEAILNRRNVQFDYQGHTRVVSFYVADEKKAFGLQVGGSSSSGRLGVRMFELKDVSNLIENPLPYQAPQYAPKRTSLRSSTLQLLFTFESRAKGFQLIRGQL